MKVKEGQSKLEIHFLREPCRKIYKPDRPGLTVVNAVYTAIIFHLEFCSLTSVPNSIMTGFTEHGEF